MQNYPQYHELSTKNKKNAKVEKNRRKKNFVENVFINLCRIYVSWKKMVSMWINGGNLAKPRKTCG